MGATSTVLRLTGEIGLKVPHLAGEAVAACMTHARVAGLARELGVSAPSIFGIEDDPDLAPVPVLVTSLFPGASLRPGDGAPAVWESVGAELAALHAVEPAAAPSGLRTFRQHPEVDPRRSLETLRGSGAVGRDLAARVLRLLGLLAPSALDGEHLVLCHGDVHAENVIAADGRYVGLIDFAGAGLLDAAWDFVGIPASAVAPALRGHARAAGETDGLPARIVWCRLQLALHRCQEPGRDVTAGVRAALAEAESVLS
ncbi:aminoglycoside phosphotransferase family protein [Georgenia subflava]|uniref:aminoglycoside phosphotransferase family protein n=1 Tax=Georgenia subflava TaxID=1622177 RepID=UPI00186B0665|nr:aminoglycoside phosphotransferase family protein [Georgenia subflava]